MQHEDDEAALIALEVALRGGFARNAITRALASLEAPGGAKRTLAWTLGLLAFALTLVAPSLRHPQTASMRDHVASLDVAEAKEVYLRPLGGLKERDVAFLATALERRLNVPVVLLPPAALPRAARLDQGVDAPARYSTHALLHSLFLSKPPDAWRLMAVTDAPLTDDGDSDVYGYANARDQVAVVSLSAFRDDLRAADRERTPAAEDRTATARDKVARVAIHELAHTEGLKHCDADGCLMAPVVHHADLTPHTALCERCARTLHATLAAPRDLVREACDRGDGLFQRGAHHAALAHYAHAQDLLDLHTAVATPGTDAKLARVHNRLGAAFMAVNLVAEGEQHIREAIALDPAYPQGHYNMAIVRAYAGDSDAALDRLKTAMTLDPDPVNRHGFAARFYLEVMDDPVRALAAFRAYKHAGGDAPDLLDRLDHLEHPYVVIFDSGETLPIRAPRRRHRHRR